ncbi:MAG: hypothetical protein H0W73_02105 [Bacteroidetes bacterium]|nr:hypothetical protein [Bacteroidota bacterium]
MRKTKNIFIALIFIFCSKLSFGQIRVNAVLDSSKIRIGEQVKLDLYVNYDASQNDLKIQWPTIGDTITGKIEVISVTQIDTTIPDKNNPSVFQQHQQILVSAYDSGYFAIPGFEFIVNNDTAHPFITPTLLLEVHTVPTDTSMTKTKDIKPPFDEKFNWKWYLNYIYWGAGIILFALAIVLITLYFSRKKKNVIVEPEKPKIPAHITALATLEKIKAEQIWKDGQVKEYYSSISDAVRLYIEERFNVFALESTTDEIMKAFRTQVVDKTSKEKLEQTLTLSDLVKFAKMTPIEDEHRFTLENAFDFVNGTKREEDITIPEPQTNNQPTQ